MPPQNTIIEPTKKSHRIIFTALIILLTAGVIGGTTYYFMGQQAKKDKEANEKATAELQKQIEKLEKTKTESTEKIKSTDTIQTSTLTDDQIFQEVATKFSFTRSRVDYFRIWGQDKVQYSLIGSPGNGSGALYAYKSGNNWINVLGGQGVNDCSVYDSVPEQYRPICTKGTSQILYYANSDRSSLNYPISQAISYIGD